VKDGEAANDADAVEDPFKDVPILSKTPAELYLFDTESDMFTIQEKEVQVEVASNGDFESESGEETRYSTAYPSLDHRSQQVDSVHLHSH
jgi:hypothetical protein